VDEEDAARLDALEATTEPGLPQDLRAEESGDRYVILTQQCDLIREPAVEPTVEVVVAQWASDPNKIGGLKNLKSWRQIVVAETQTPDGPAALIANSRRRSLIDKRALLRFPARQALPNSDDDRRRFAWWAGARYYRRPVPHDLAVRVERPLKSAIRDNAALRGLAQQFQMFVLEVQGESLRLYGIYESEANADDLERVFAELCEQVPFEGLSPEDCEVRHVAQAPLTWAFGAGAYPLDLESHSGPEDPVPPVLSS
jgi:hypothetical protein